MIKSVILGIDAWYPQVDGGTNVVVNYCKYLGESADCTIVVPSYGKKMDTEGEKNYFGKVFHNKSLGVPFIGFRNSTPGFDKKLKKFLNAKRPAILHAHSPFAICSYFARYGKKHNIPVVFTFHTKFKDEFMRITHSRLCTAIMMSVIMRNIKKADYVWTVSQNAAQTLRSYGYNGEIKIMRNGTDIPVADRDEVCHLKAKIAEEYRIPADERIFLYSGRVVSVKNIKFSFAVIAELKKRGFKCKFIVVGGGEGLDEHKKYVADMGISDSVIFTGFVGDRQRLRAFYSAADLLLFSSMFDTLGLVVQEAAACHTPSLVPTDSGACEMIEDGKTGYICPLDVNAWADRIESIFSDGNYAEICENCSSVVHTWATAIDDARAEYERILIDYHSKK